MDKLLLIDDEDDVRYSFKRIFNSPELELETAASGEEGLEVINSFQPDLVLMDVRMGGITGLETLRRIRQDDAKLPVIMMTAFGTTQTAIEAMKLGAYDYLLKPFDVPQLKQLVADALKAARGLEGVGDELLELWHVERLKQVVVGAEFHRLDRGLGGAERGHHDDRQLGVVLPNAAKCLQPGDAAHPDVHQHEIRLKRIDDLQPLLTAGCGFQFQFR